LVTAHAVSTVSPSYAEEILTHEFGMGLEGLVDGEPFSRGDGVGVPAPPMPRGV
jgi:glycogen synthase